MCSRRLWLALALAWTAPLLSLPVRVGALVVVQRDFAQLVSGAEQVVEGTVVAVEEAPDASGIQRTLVTLADLVVLKGQVAGDRFVLDVAGGEKGGLRFSVLDLPELRLGERYVLFVAANGRAVFPVVGVWQGVFRVVRDDERQAEVVTTYDGSAVTGRAGRNLLRRKQPRGGERAVSVQEFRNWVLEEASSPSR